MHAKHGRDDQCPDRGDEQDQNQDEVGHGAALSTQPMLRGYASGYRNCGSRRQSRSLTTTYTSLATNQPTRACLSWAQRGPRGAACHEISSFRVPSRPPSTSAPRLPCRIPFVEILAGYLNGCPLRAASGAVDDCRQARPCSLPRQGRRAAAKVPPRANANRDGAPRMAVLQGWISYVLVGRVASLTGGGLVASRSPEAAESATWWRCATPVMMPR